MKRQLFLFLAVVLFLAAVPAWAQITAVQGTVVDKTGTPVAGAAVSMYDSNTGRKYNLKTDKKGEFSSIGVNQGSYQLTVTGKDGDLLYSCGYPVRMDAPGGVNRIDIDLSKPCPTAGAGGSGSQGQTVSQEEYDKMTPDQQKAVDEQRMKGMSPEQRKEYEKAKSENEKINKENKTIGVLNEKLNAANAAMQAKNFDEAIAQLKAANELDATHDLVWGRLGDAYYGAKQWDNAADAYTHAISLIQALPPDKQNKGNLAAYTNQLGASLASSGKTQDGVAAFDKAAQLDPTKAATYYFNEGAVMTNLSTHETDNAKKNADLKAANDAFEKAVAAKPDYAEAWYQKGLNLVNMATYDKSGKITPAPGTIEAFEKYLELQPQGGHAEEAKGIIQAMGGTVQTSYGTPKKKGK